MFGAGDDSPPGRVRAWGNCLLPLPSLARLGRAASTYSSRRPAKRLRSRPASPGRTPPPSRTFYQCHPLPRTSAVNCAAGMPCSPGCPMLRNQLCFRRSAGTPPHTLRAQAHASTSNVGTRGDGGGVRPASPGPVASSPVLTIVPLCRARPMHAAGCVAKVHGWTPCRPSAAVVGGSFGAVGLGVLGSCAAQW